MPNLPTSTQYSVPTFQSYVSSQTQPQSVMPSTPNTSSSSTLTFPSSSSTPSSSSSSSYQPTSSATLNFQNYISQQQPQSIYKPSVTQTSTYNVPTFQPQRQVFGVSNPTPTIAKAPEFLTSSYKQPVTPSFSYQATSSATPNFQNYIFGQQQQSVMPSYKKPQVEQANIDLFAKVTPLVPTAFSESKQYSEYKLPQTQVEKAMQKTNIALTQLPTEYKNIKTQEYNEALKLGFMGTDREKVITSANQAFAKETEPIMALTTKEDYKTAVKEYREGLKQFEPYYNPDTNDYSVPTEKMAEFNRLNEIYTSKIKPTDDIVKPYADKWSNYLNVRMKEDKMIPLANLLQYQTQKKYEANVKPLHWGSKSQEELFKEKASAENIKYGLMYGQEPNKALTQKQQLYENLGKDWLYKPKNVLEIMPFIYPLKQLNLIGGKVIDYTKLGSVGLFGEGGLVEKKTGVNLLDPTISGFENVSGKIDKFISKAPVTGTMSDIVNPASLIYYPWQGLKAVGRMTAVNPLGTGMMATQPESLLYMGEGYALGDITGKTATSMLASKEQSNVAKLVVNKEGQKEIDRLRGMMYEAEGAKVQSEKSSSFFLPISKAGAYEQVSGIPLIGEPIAKTFGKGYAQAGVDAITTEINKKNYLTQEQKTNLINFMVKEKTGSNIGADVTNIALIGEVASELKGRGMFASLTENKPLVISKGTSTKGAFSIPFKEGAKVVWKAAPTEIYGGYGATSRQYNKELEPIYIQGMAIRGTAAVIGGTITGGSAYSQVLKSQGKKGGIIPWFAKGTEWGANIAEKGSENFGDWLANLYDISKNPMRSAITTKGKTVSLMTMPSESISPKPKIFTYSPTQTLSNIYSGVKSSASSKIQTASDIFSSIKSSMTTESPTIMKSKTQITTPIKTVTTTKSQTQTPTLVKTQTRIKTQQQSTPTFFKTQTQTQVKTPTQTTVKSKVPILSNIMSAIKSNIKTEVPVTAKTAVPVSVRVPTEVPVTSKTEVPAVIKTPTNVVVSDKGAFFVPPVSPFSLGGLPTGDQSQRFGGGGHMSKGFINALADANIVFKSEFGYMDMPMAGRRKVSILSKPMKRKPMDIKSKLRAIL